MTYRPEEIEPKWRQYWQNKGIYQTPPKGKKAYCLDMFPYPSGAGLHVGHVRIYTASDVISRFWRMKGFRVLHPMGWDAFGLPAENDAIKKQVNPNKLVPQNIANFKRQMQMMGFSYDWEREVDTSSPDYYRWTQWLFVKLFKLGLLYRQKVPINWCPACRTGLANEEVLPNGTHERCGQPVTKKDLPQWLFRITDYADRLLEELEGLDWPEGILEMQRNWIGRSEGITVEYPVFAKATTGKPIAMIACYSTRPDTNFGATFIVIAPEHPMLRKLKIKNEKLKIELDKYIRLSKRKSELERTELAKEKTGVFTGRYALNRLTGQKMPIWVSDFVVLTAGTGVVVGVPAHDERDWQFAQKYQLEILPVIKPQKGSWDYQQRPFTDIDEAVVFNSGFLDGLTPSKAKEKIVDYLVKKGWGKRAVKYHLRDWVFSRQRYWGEPIPLVYCPQCAKKGITWWDVKEAKNTSEVARQRPRLLRGGKIKKGLAGWFPVPEKDLPVKLPYLKKYEPTGTGESPLSTVKEWVEIKCPHCGGPARRETDTMPNWAGSCWYFLRFADSKNAKVPFGSKEVNYWCPVDWYLGGAEHAVLHLLYARFWVKAFYDLGLISFKEPFLRLSSVGMVLAEDGRKMSKSLGNVMNPDEVVAQFGADTLRVYEMFMAPFSQAVSWNTKSLWGVYRFLSRIWRLYQTEGKIAKEHSGSGPEGLTRSGLAASKELRSHLHRLIQKAEADIQKVKFNTTVAAMMEFVNAWSEEGATLSRDDACLFLKILAPFAPYLAEELYCQLDARRYKLDAKFSLHLQPWSKYDPKLAKEEQVTIIIQVNGKVRGQVKLPSPDKVEDSRQSRNNQATERSSVERLAKKEQKVSKYLKGKKIKKVIFIPGRLINFVI